MYKMTYNSLVYLKLYLRCKLYTVKYSKQNNSILIIHSDRHTHVCVRAYICVYAYIHTYTCTHIYYNTDYFQQIIARMLLSLLFDFYHHMLVLPVFKLHVDRIMWNVFLPLTFFTQHL